jgi:translation initiation factor 2 beta subunit (eIF-2beta)/eIF-5
VNDKKLLETLDQATVTCADCGDKYGVHSVRYSSWWVGKCHVCGKERPVTESRDFAYFFPTRKKLSAKLAEQN